MSVVCAFASALTGVPQPHLCFDVLASTSAIRGFGFTVRVAIGSGSGTFHPVHRRVRPGLLRKVSLLAGFLGDLSGSKRGKAAVC